MKAADTLKAQTQSVMMSERAVQFPPRQLRNIRTSRGFTLLELLVVVVVIGVLASLLLPALAKARSRAQGIMCLNNTKQLNLAWVLYADDNNGRLPYNLGGDLANRGIAPRSYFNWVNNILDWELSSDNTNTATITEASLARYNAITPAAYRCPSDNVLSRVQRNAGWSGGRVRSYSMNAMIGDAGEVSVSGGNQNNPGYVQFFTLASIPSPARIFVFLDEHPDSINDGYFLNRAYGSEWIDLPASYHNGAASFSFADGHAEAHRWVLAFTRRSPNPDAAPLPLSVSKSDRTDFDWVIERMSVHQAPKGNPSF